jgi:hypothetical protein
MELSEAQQTRGGSIYNMCYEGNRLLRDWERKKEKATSKTAIKASKKPAEEDGKDDGDKVHFQIGKRVSFSSKP